MVVLVTGATGLIGRSLVRSLVADGERVNVLSRDAARAVALFDTTQVKAFSWDPATQEVPQASLHDADTIYHLMGEPIGGRWTKSKVNAIVTSRVTSAAKLARAIQGRNCRFICASSFGIYPGERGVVYEESLSLPAPANKAQQILQDAENTAASALNFGARVNMVRFGLVCAPDGYPKKLVRLFQKGISVVVGDGEQIVPLVHIEDAISMLRWIASGKAGDGPVNCVAPQLVRMKDVAAAIADHLGGKVRFRLPDWLARPLLGGSADYFLLSYDLRPRRALEAGYVFRHPEPMAILKRALSEGSPLATAVGLRPPSPPLSRF